jgi:DNA-binding MarR family transcriptional regulator
MSASRRGSSLSSGSSSRAHVRRSRAVNGGGGSNSRTARAALDRVLELVGRRRLSAAELRLLLHLIDREAGIPELAEALGQRPGDVRRGGRRLAARGLVRWRHVDPRKDTRLAITPAGLTTVQALLTAVGGLVDATAAPQRPLR